jgi:hypothetical protein
MTQNNCKGEKECEREIERFLFGRPGDSLCCGSWTFVFFA